MENISDSHPIVPDDERAEPAMHEARLSPGSRSSGLAATVLRGRALPLLCGALLIGAAFWWLQYSTSSICCGDFDAYYHFRWSQMLWQGITSGHFPPQFKSLPLTTLNPQDYVDHHFLFHVLQIPFTWFNDFQRGAKLGTWLFACLAVFSCYWLIVRYRVSYPLLWLLALIGSAAPFLYRIHMGKAMSVSIVLLVAGIYLLFERKYVWLLPLAYVFALTYDMVFLLWVASGFWVLTTLWNERCIRCRAFGWAVGGFLLVVVGTGLGFIINPYFPHNLQLLYEHLIIKVTPKEFTTAVGGEWYPYNTWEFLQNCGLAVVAMVVGYIAFRDSDKKEMERPLFFLLFSTFLLLVNARWRRFSEYWPPFAILFAAFALEPLVARARLYTRRDLAAYNPTDNPIGNTTADATNNATAAQPHRPVDAPMNVTPDASPVDVPALRAANVERARVIEWVLVATCFVALSAPMIWCLYVTASDISSMPGPQRYSGGMEWIKKNVPEGEIVFNSDWDDFPKLFFYDPNRPFVAGLDPTYLLDKNPELMRAYERIGKGEEENPGPIIREKFGARYVFTDLEHEDFYNNALDSGWFDEVYTDDDCSVLRIRDAKGPPPPDNAPDEEREPADEGIELPDNQQSGDAAPQTEPGAGTINAAPQQ